MRYVLLQIPSQQTIQPFIFLSTQFGWLTFDVWQTAAKFRPNLYPHRFQITSPAVGAAQADSVTASEGNSWFELRQDHQVEAKLG
jgi:hypothetical protein